MLIRMRKGKKGQSMLEYITIFTAIVAAVVYFGYKKMNPAVETVLDKSASKITSSVSNF